MHTVVCVQTHVCKYTQNTHIVQTQSARKVLHERCVTRHVEVVHGVPANPMVPSPVWLNRRARGNGVVREKHFFVYSFSAEVIHQQNGCYYKPAVFITIPSTAQEMGELQSLSVRKKLKLCPVKCPVPTHDAREGKERRKTQFPSDFNSPFFSGISDFCAFLLLCQDLMWPNRIMDRECRTTTYSRICPVWPTQLIRGHLFACWVLIYCQHLKIEGCAMDFYSWLLFLKKSNNSFISANIYWASSLCQTFFCSRLLG